jgi:hypothetical protein
LGRKISFIQRVEASEKCEHQKNIYLGIHIEGERPRPIDFRKVTLSKDTET